VVVPFFSDLHRLSQAAFFRAYISFRRGPDSARSGFCFVFLSGAPPLRMFEILRVPSTFISVRFPTVWSLPRLPFLCSSFVFCPVRTVWFWVSSRARVKWRSSRGRGANSAPCSYELSRLWHPIRSPSSRSVFRFFSLSRSHGAAGYVFSRPKNFPNLPFLFSLSLLFSRAP